MLVKKKYWYEDEEFPYKRLEKDIELTDKYDLLNTKFPNPNNGEEPNSRMDQGRNCPNCAGRLFFKGPLATEGAIHLRCKRCGREFFMEDIDNPTEIVDRLYKTIPQSVMNKWNENRKKYRKRGE